MSQPATALAVDGDQANAGRRAQPDRRHGFAVARDIEKSPWTQVRGLFL